MRNPISYLDRGEKEKITGRARRRNSRRRRKLLLWYCECVRWTIERESLKELCVSLLCSNEIVIKFTILWRLMIRMAEIVILPPSFHSIPFLFLSTSSPCCKLNEIIRHLYRIPIAADSPTPLLSRLLFVIFKFICKEL